MISRSFLAAAWCLLAPLARDACAQSITWRIPTYGVETSVAGVNQQSLAFDAHNNLYTLEMISDVDGMSARVKHHGSAGGAVAWQRDLPSSLYQLTFSETIFGRPNAAMVPLGDDVAVVTTANSAQDLSNYNSGQTRARVARLAAGDGSILWQAVESAPIGKGYNSVAVTRSGDVLAAGAVGKPGGVSSNGHVAKYAGDDGTLLWGVDLDPASCGAPSAAFTISAVAADGNGDVFAAGATERNNNGQVLCVFKLSADTGATLWWQTYQPSASHAWSYAPTLFVDANGNALIGVNYASVEVGADAYAVAKLDGLTGNVAWVHAPIMLEGQPFTYPSFGMDAAGNAIVSGGHTQVFDAADGHALWAQEAPVGGAIAIDSDHDILVAQNDAIDNPVSTVRKFDFFALDPADGSQRWASSLAVNTSANWSYGNLIAADGGGHFAALQTQSEVCCSEMQALTALGSTSDGSIAWSVSDPDFGPSVAELPEDRFLHNRGSVLTADGGVVTAGETHRSNDLRSRRIMTVKRAQRDGRLLWRMVADVGRDFCTQSSLLVDADGDIVVAGVCDDLPVTIKYRGSDGQVLWTGTERDHCDFAIADTVVRDSANDIYASGVCGTGDAEDQLTVKYSGTNGTPVWMRHSEGRGEVSEIPSTPMQLTAGGDGLLLAARAADNTNIVANKLRFADGVTQWTHYIDMSANSGAPSKLAAFPNGDALITAATTMVRLSGSDGGQTWRSDSAPDVPVDVAFDASGNPVLVGRTAVWKLDAATGVTAWNYQNANQYALPSGLNDVIIAPDASVLAAGAAHPGGGNPLLHVIALDPGTGAPLWSLTDPSRPFDSAIGVLVARDGGILVSANYATDSATPWSLVRITGAFADGIFANGFEE